MEADVQVVEEGVLRILLTGVGVGEHSFAADIPQVPAVLASLARGVPEYLGSPDAGHRSYRERF